MKISRNIGNNLKQERKYNGFTQRKMAEKLLMTQRQYSKFENENFELIYKQILKICEILDITPNELFDVQD